MAIVPEYARSSGDVDLVVHPGQHQVGLVAIRKEQRHGGDHAVRRRARARVFRRCDARQRQHAVKRKLVARGRPFAFRRHDPSVRRQRPRGVDQRPQTRGADAVIVGDEDAHGRHASQLDVVAGSERRVELRDVGLQGFEPRPVARVPDHGGRTAGREEREILRDGWVRRQPNPRRLPLRHHLFPGTLRRQVPGERVGCERRAACSENCA